MSDTDFKQILLVEDDPRDAELTLAALEEHQLAKQVVVVDNGVDALNYLYLREKYQTRVPGHPILVLLDLKLPKIDGREVLKAIKSDEHLRTIPVVVLSSSREVSDLAECYHYGVNAFVVKPLNFDEFANAIKRLAVFWASINEAPPFVARHEAGILSGQGVLPGKVNHENAAPHFAPGG